MDILLSANDISVSRINRTIRWLKQKYALSSSYPCHTCATGTSILGSYFNVTFQIGCYLKLLSHWKRSRLWLEETVPRGHVTILHGTRLPVLQLICMITRASKCYMYTYYSYDNAVTMNSPLLRMLSSANASDNIPTSGENIACSWQNI